MVVRISRSCKNRAHLNGICSNLHETSPRLYIILQEGKAIAGSCICVRQIVAGMKLWTQ